MPRRSGTAFLLALFALGCEAAPKDAAEPQATEPSPNASILPAPLATGLVTARKGVPGDAGVVSDGDGGGVDAGSSVPESLREDRALDRDVAGREVSGLRLRARLRWLDLPPFPRLPESNVDATQRLRDSLGFELAFDVGASGRLCVRLDSDAFVLPRGAEFRSRSERLGQLLLWDNGSRYAVLPPGTLRAVLTERRADAAPLVKPKIARLGGGNVLGLVTEKRELSTPLGRLALEQAHVVAAGAGAELVCRFLVDLIAADPLNAACSRTLLPLRAELFSNAGGHLLFEVVRVDRDPDPHFDPEALLAPPPGATFAQAELPAEGAWLVPTAAELRELRLKPAARTEKAPSSAPKQGLLLVNRSESLRYVLLDGVVVARVPPRRELHVDGLLPGKYALATLDFLGDDPTPLRIVELPARVALGDEVEASR